MYQELLPCHATELTQVEKGSLYGYSLATSPSRFAIGVPGEAIGTVPRAGAFDVYTHNAATTTPTVFGGASEETSGVSGDPETGDLMGFSLAMVDYRPTATSTATVVAVSAPGEDGAADADGGWVFEFDAGGTLTQRLTIDQGEDGVPGTRENGDLFGSGLAAVNRAPGAVTSWEKLLLAVGSPGEDDTSLTPLVDRGWVQAFSLIGMPGDHAMDTTSELDDAGAQWRPDMQLGMWIHATAGHLVVADPLAESPAVYAIPWENLLSDAEQPVQVFRPADFGAAVTDAGSFGSSLT